MFTQEQIEHGEHYYIIELVLQVANGKKLKNFVSNTAVCDLFVVIFKSLLWGYISANI